MPQSGDVAFAYEHTQLALRALSALEDDGSGDATLESPARPIANPPGGDLQSVVNVFRHFMCFAPISKQGESSIVSHAMAVARARAKAFGGTWTPQDNSHRSCAVAMLEAAFFTIDEVRQANGSARDGERSRTLFRAIKLVAAAECVTPSHVVWLIYCAACVLRESGLDGSSGHGSSDVVEASIAADTRTTGRLWTVLFLAHMCDVLQALGTRIPPAAPSGNGDDEAARAHPLAVVFASCGTMMREGNLPIAQCCFTALERVCNVCDDEVASALLLRGDALPQLLRAVAVVQDSTLHHAVLTVLRRLTSVSSANRETRDTLVGYAVSMLASGPAEARFGLHALQHVLGAERRERNSESRLSPRGAAAVLAVAAASDLETPHSGASLVQCLVLLRRCVTLLSACSDSHPSGVLL